MHNTNNIQSVNVRTKALYTSLTLPITYVPEVHGENIKSVIEVSLLGT